MSCKQKSDIYNYYHKYEKMEKQLSSGHAKMMEGHEDDDDYVDRYMYMYVHNIFIGMVHIVIHVHVQCKYLAVCADIL